MPVLRRHLLAAAVILLGMGRTGIITRQVGKARAVCNSMYGGLMIKRSERLSSILKQLSFSSVLLSGPAVVHPAFFHTYR